MNPSVLAKHYCANYLNDGACNGVDFKRPALRQVRFLREGTECLVKCGGRCSYFESAVLPMREWDWAGSGNVINPQAGRAFKALANQYLRTHSGLRGLAAKQRTCPECRRQGRNTPIGPRLRFCAPCAKSLQAA